MSTQHTQLLVLPILRNSMRRPLHNHKCLSYYSRSSPILSHQHQHQHHNNTKKMSEDKLKFSTKTTSSNPLNNKIIPYHSTKMQKRGRIVCITSGKGGVGKTTTAASFAYGLAQRTKPKRTVVIDFDIGLRNLDIHLGIERRIIFDFVNVLFGECSLHQALVKDKRCDNLYMLAASQTRDKDCLTSDGVQEILYDLAATFDYIILDSPAGIESGARHAMYFADDAIIVTNPEMSSCRDADKMVGFIHSKSRRGEIGSDVCPVNQMLLITRYDPERVQLEESLSVADIEDLLGVPVVGVIPESKDVLTCTNMGNPVISLGESASPAAAAYLDMVDRYCGEEKELRFTTPQPPSFLKRLFGQ